ncbi:6-phospho-beta-glucosidase [Luteibacter aegosomatissinici]|uniref:family 4 glycosyl hydrolase n=1 Tax=Luteibacter aegosomatissinici TaxID=2911539 RepID=UPI001FF8F401|nr:6-phospho-beta-glucosidase [Luteibacter aegosomatissinici]UPG92523.1 6-phospho-beta-glucosidase [Luteibacter aegosomatissinici]
MNRRTDRKIALVGGGGVRSPLVVFGVNEAAQALGAAEMVLYDPDPSRLRVMVDLGNAIVRRFGGELRLRGASSIEDTIEGADFVLNSIRIGGITGRAADERVAIEHGYPGQETTGPAGVAMGLRTIPIAIEQARLVERLAPDAWLVNFTNPAGLITQAVNDHSKAKIVGICDTPTELFHNIARALGEPYADVECDYVGLNHLGWVRSVRVRGEEKIDTLLDSDELLRSLYLAPLFDTDMIRTLRLIPTEYLFFYYERQRALGNQRRQGGSRGAEIAKLNDELFATLSARLAAGQGDEAVDIYAAYLNQRSGSYMKLEAEGGSAFDADVSLDVDPFRVATGYHRIAIDVMSALTGARPAPIVVNTRNRGAVPDLPEADVVETLCDISLDRIEPRKLAPLPDAVAGLVRSVKAYERAAIASVLEGTQLGARKAMLIHPAIGEWTPTASLLDALLGHANEDGECLCQGPVHR